MYLQCEDYPQSWHSLTCSLENKERKQRLWSHSAMSDSFWPHGLYPTRFLHPWDFPGNGLPFPSLGDLPNPGIKPGSPTLQADALLFEPPGKPGGTGKPLEDTVLAIPGHPKPEDLSEEFRDSRLHIAWQLEGHVHSGASDTVKQRLWAWDSAI